MTDAVLGLISLGLIFVGILTGYPMAFTFIFISLVFGWMGIGDRVVTLMQYQFFALMRDTTLAAIPLFLFMGFVLEQSGLMERMFKALRLLLGRVRGSLYLIVLIVATVFAAATGIVGASVTVLGVMAAPIMMSSKYDTRLSAGAIAAGGTLGVLIPPSIILILYAILTGESIGALFAAALLPGLVATVLYMAAVLVQVLRKPELGPAGPRYTFRQKLVAMGRIWDAALLIALVIGGIYGRIFSPTEAAGMGAMGAFIIALARGGLSFADVKEVLIETSYTTASLFSVLIGAWIFSNFVNIAGMPEALLAMVNQAGFSPMTVILMILAVYLILGCVFESLSMLLLTVPIFFPLVISLGFDPVWFGIVVVVVTEISLITPPVGLNVFVLRGVIEDVSTATIFRGVTPFWVVDIIRLALMVFVPWLILVLPNSM